jgi:hypothetical protein
LSKKYLKRDDNQIVMCFDTVFRKSVYFSSVTASSLIHEAVIQFHRFATILFKPPFGTFYDDDSSQLVKFFVALKPVDVAIWNMINIF